MTSKAPFLILMTCAILFQACEKKEIHFQSPASQDISKSTDDYTRAFNLHNIEQIHSLWTENALLVNLSTGETIEGSQNIAEYFKTQFEKEGAENVKVTLSSVSSSGDNTALAKGIMETTFTSHGPTKESFIAEYARNGDRWAIKSLTINALNEPPSHFDQLKDLDWLAGKWVDEDDNIDVIYNNEWDKHKNFLTQHFEVTVLDEDELSGNQVIGWNPATKKIQSWIFDSDGGFGESVWSKDGDRWLAEVNFTLPQGGKATSTHIYTKIDKDTYTFASENREVDGKLLPNIGPFKIVKQ